MGTSPNLGEELQDSADIAAQKTTDKQTKKNSPSLRGTSETEQSEVERRGYIETSGRQSTLVQTSEMQARLRFLSESSQASKTKSLTSTLTLALRELMECKAPDGHYLVTRKVHWQAIFRILVDRGIYPDGTDYRGFCCYIEEAFSTMEWRVPLDYHSLKNISQTMFVRPFAEWRYDEVYGISRKSYERMRCIADTPDKQLSEIFTRQ